MVLIMPGDTLRPFFQNLTCGARAEPQRHGSKELSAKKYIFIELDDGKILTGKPYTSW